MYKNGNKNDFKTTFILLCKTYSKHLSFIKLIMIGLVFTTYSKSNLSLMKSKIFSFVIQNYKAAYYIKLISS